MLRLEAIPHLDFFNVFEGDRSIGTVSAKELHDVFDDITMIVHLDGDHAHRMQLHLSAKRNNRSLFEEAIEEIR